MASPSLNLLFCAHVLATAILARFLHVLSMYVPQLVGCLSYRLRTRLRGFGVFQGMAFGSGTAKICWEWSNLSSMAPAE